MSQPRAAAPEPSEIAGRYQVLQKLGAGAFGTVFKVKDKVLGRILAIKTIRLEGLAAAGAGLDELMNRFTREAQVSAQLKHPNIVTIYDIGEADGLSYLAMEFIDGVGLDRIIAQAGRVPVERAAALGAQVADALDFAHRNRVVHRDIKPANIMVEPGDRVKVTDFGIAKVTESGDHLTMTGSLLGTPSYMSPEQARGTEIDGRSDLFAVGAILYEMVTGQKAFRGDSITGLIFKIITEEPPDVRELEPSVPEEMARVIKRALSKAPEIRYQSGRELADDLLALTHGAPMPTLRTTETDTAREASSAFPTLRSSPTVAGATPTKVSPPPMDPTRVVSPPAPAAADPTRLMDSASTRPVAPAPAPPARRAPGPPTPPPPPAAAPRAPAPAAARPAPARASSKTGLVIALVAAFLLVAGGGGLAALYFFVLKPKPPVEADGTVTPTTLTETTSSTPAGSTGTGSADPNAGMSGGTTVVTSPPVSLAGNQTEAGTTAGTGTTTATGSSGGPATGTTGAGGSTGTATAGTGKGTKAAGTDTGPTDSGPPPETGAGGTDALAFLDREPPVLNGREQGDAVASTYRSPHGRSDSGNFGASGRLRARPRVPPGLTVPERRAAGALLHMMSFQAAYEKKTGHYGSFTEVLPSRLGSASTLQRYGYRFDLKVESDGYHIAATPLSLGTGRALVADDSGFIRFAEE